MNNEEWLKLRVKIHHDWLQNRYLTFLTAWGDHLNGEVSTPAERKELTDQLYRWKDKKQLLEILIDNAEVALSPRQLLDESPLNVLAENDRRWLGEVIHELYCVRTRIREKVNNLEAMLEKADMAVLQMGNKLQGVKISKDEVTGEELVQIFTLFSKAISALPQEIQIP